MSGSGISLNHINTPSTTQSRSESSSTFAEQNRRVAVTPAAELPILHSRHHAHNAVPVVHREPGRIVCEPEPNLLVVDRSVDDQILRLLRVLLLLTPPPRLHLPYLVARHVAAVHHELLHIVHGDYVAARGGRHQHDRLLRRLHLLLLERLGQEALFGVEVHVHVYF